MLKRLFAILLLSLPAFSSTTVTGTLRNLGTGTVSSGSYVRLWLRGCSGNQPRVSGTAIIAPSSGGTYFFDFAPNASGVVSGTVYSTRDVAGTGDGDIQCGTSYTSVWYGVQVFVGGKGGPETPVHAKSGATLDLTSVTPITVAPVSTAPTGDTAYIRLDGGNSPVPLLNALIFNNARYSYGFSSIAATLASACAGSPGMAYIAPGSYTVSSTILPPSTCTIFWDNVVLTAATGLNDDVIRVDGKTDVHFLGQLKIDGNKSNQSTEPALGANGLFVKGTTNFTFDFLEVTNTRVDGVKFRDSSNVRGNSLYVSAIGDAGRGGGNGLKIETSSSGTSADYNITNFDCQTTVAQNCGFVFGADTSHYVQRVNLTNVTAVNAGDESIEFNTCDGCKITNLSSKNPNSTGLYFRQSINGAAGVVKVEGGKLGVDIGSSQNTDAVTDGIAIGQVIATGITGDATNGAGVRVNANVGTVVKNVTFSSIIAANNNRGVAFVGSGTLKNIVATAIISHDNNQSGVVFDAVTGGVTLSTVRSYNNGQDGAYVGTKAGVYLSNSTDVQLGNITAFDDQGGKTQVYGLTSAGTSDRLRLNFCDCRDDLAVTAGILLAGASNTADRTYGSTGGREFIGSPAKWKNNGTNQFSFWLYDTTTAVNAGGLWSIDASGGKLLMRRNSAVAGDFTSSVIEWQVDNTDVVTLPNGLKPAVTADAITWFKKATHASLDLASVASGACTAVQTETISGVALGDRCSVASGSATADGTWYACNATATDTAKWSYCNLSGAPVDRASDTYTIRVLR